MTASGPGKTLQIKFKTQDIRDLLNAAAGQKGVGTSTWARGVLIDHARRTLIESAESSRALESIETRKAG